ncbi:hypothetical protein BS47DRAFT_776310 [Hydnum rufescens UP504]|uniref:Uncharacterized protein n=1 Tax=Hydnum rufescens UP504 TaxID=1448309 RepID=A0A9P6DLZ4_9AGAM|nr:hypothetical protein BS47DRAFT_776310 [Hydnum rufescens UP504]
MSIPILELPSSVFTRKRILRIQARGEMKDTRVLSPKWLQRLSSRSRPHRATTQGTGQNSVVGPISTNAIASAESVLRWVSKVPGGDKVQVRIGDALQVIKRLNVVNLSICLMTLADFPTSFATHQLPFITKLPFLLISS